VNATLYHRMQFALALFATLIALSVSAPTKDSPCEPVSVLGDFNLTKYTSHKWFIQKQQAIKYLPVNERFCVVATYDQTDATHVKVHNYANIGKVNGEVDDSDTHVKALGGICGKATSETGKLAVGPCDLSIISHFAFGPYWVVAAGDDNCVKADCPQPETYTWAFVSGGQPTIKTAGGCTPGTGVNNAGMWIFTSDSDRNQTQIDMIDAIGTQKGFDMSMLGDVVQAGCKYAPAAPNATLIAPNADTTLYKTSGDECGEATLDSKYASYAEKFAGLKEGTCASQGYTVADGSQTMKVPVLGDITIAKFKKATVDDIWAMTEAEEAPCCQGACKVAGQEKYYSLASGIHGDKHCGECCMDPKHYNLYHFFEKNLTKAEGNSPCSGFGYQKYDSTVTHGVWPVTMTLDLYNQ